MSDGKTHIKQIIRNGLFDFNSYETFQKYGRV